MNSEELRQEEQKQENAEEGIEGLKSLLEQEKARAQGYFSNWQRTQADFINFKRRSEQEMAEMVKFANTALVFSLLPVLDDLERAFASLPSNLAELTWVDGIQLIQRKLHAILEAQGLSEVKSLGETLDLNLHEAVMRGEGEEGKVLAIVQKGYKLHDRVLRPSLVVVGDGMRGKAEEIS
ncbi:MAG: nucleotide exchange factor GrpE [Chloroflexota bacterium]